MGIRENDSEAKLRLSQTQAAISNVSNRKNPQRTTVKPMTSNHPLRNISSHLGILMPHTNWRFIQARGRPCPQKGLGATTPRLPRPHQPTARSPSTAQPKQAISPGVAGLFNPPPSQQAPQVTVSSSPLVACAVVFIGKGGYKHSIGNLTN